MWEQTLLVFSTDNGGPIYYNGSGGGNNYPLKGGKLSNWEGGIRGNAFVSGGWLPPAVRGTKYDGLIALWDWYATFASLAGVDPTDFRAARAQLPPIDSIDMSAVLLGTAVHPPRLELPIATEPRASNISTAPLCATYAATPYYDDAIAPPGDAGRCTTVSGLIVDERSKSGGLWKLLTGEVDEAVYTGPHWPNVSTSMAGWYKQQCADGCLYDLDDDPLETTDLAADSVDTVARLHAKLSAYEASAFNPHRGSSDPKSCETAVQQYGGFWGPWER